MHAQLFCMACSCAWDYMAALIDNSIQKYIKQDFKCHSSNGVVFCFFEDRVFVTCMDKECESMLARHGQSYFLMSKLVEEQVFGKCQASTPGTGTKKQRGVLGDALMHRTGNNGAGALGRSGLTPCMLQDNPALRARAFRALGDNGNAGAGMDRRGLQSLASWSPPAASPHLCTAAAQQGVVCGETHATYAMSASSIYELTAADACTVLSPTQQDFIEKLERERDRLLAQKQATSKAIPKMNLRDYCKVPWR